MNTLFKINVIPNHLCIVHLKYYYINLYREVINSKNVSRYKRQITVSHIISNQLTR